MKLMRYKEKTVEWGAPLMSAMFVLALGLFTAGCGGGGDDGGGSTTTTPGGTTGGGTTGGGKAVPMSFSLSGVVMLVANDQVIEAAPATGALKAKGENSLFTYKIYNQDEGLKTRGLKAATTGVTNLLAVDAYGNATTAINSEFPIKVMYSAVNPEGTKVYLALDNGWYGSDGNDYQSFIAQNNCAIYEVTLADNSYQCVVEGVFAQNYDENYYQKVSSNQKPIQFDTDGNAFFLGTTFTTIDGGGWCDGQNWDVLTEANNWDPNLYDDNGVVTGCTDEALAGGFTYQSSVWIDNTNWNPTLFKHIEADGTTETLTQDNENIQYFTALNNGDVVFQGWNDTTQKQTFALLKGNTGSRISMLEADWGLEFFTTDSESTIIFSDWTNSAGLRMVKPVGAGVQKTVFGLENFAANNGGTYTNPTPRRVILADDGNLYGVFESWNSYYDSTTTQWVSTSALTVYQVLPFDPVPKASMDMGNDGWWSFMQGTPFQVSRGFLFYREKIANVVSGNVTLGPADTIAMVNLQTREKTTLLYPQSDTDGRYEIYSWRLSGTELYFSALNNTVNKVVTGKVDIVQARNGAAATDYLSIKETASAVGATAKIQDIAVLKATRPESDPGGNPTATFVASDENKNSVSIVFSKYMDNQSVLDNLTFQEDTYSAAVDYLPIWINKTLHLIPDTDGLVNSTGAPLLDNYSYTVTLGTAINDYYFYPIDQGSLSVSVSTPPTSGWYVGLTDAADATFSSGKVAKFAGRTNSNTWGDEYYKVFDNVPLNFELKYSAKNLSYVLGGISINQSTASTNWNGKYLDQYIDGWYCSLDTKNNWYSFNSVDGNDFATGNWMVYRFRLEGMHYTMDVSKDGTTFTNIFDKQLLTTSASQELYLRVNEKIFIDNLQLTTLDGNDTGTPTLAGVGDLINEDFDSTLPDGTTLSAPLDLSNKITTDAVVK